MNHLAAEWEKSRGVGGREDGRPDLADDSVNGVITTIPLSLQYKQEVTTKAALSFFTVSFSSSLYLYPSSVCQRYTLVCFFLPSLSEFDWLRLVWGESGCLCMDACVCLCVCEGSSALTQQLF